MTFNCMIAGVGGQGTVLASRIISEAAMKRGLNVRTTETIGMAQRGGSVVGHTRIGDNIHSPLIPLGGADVLIAFEPAEAARQLPFLSQKGTLIVCDVPVKPVSGTLTGQVYEAQPIIEYLKANAPNIVIVNGEPIKEKYAKMLNVALLGAAAESGVFPFDTQALLDVISEMQRFRDENLESFEMGRRA